MHDSALIAVIDWNPLVTAFATLVIVAGQAIQIWISRQNGQKTEALHEQMNGARAEAERIAGELGHVKGVIEGLARGRSEQKAESIEEAARAVVHDRDARAATSPPIR